MSATPIPIGTVRGVEPSRHTPSERCDCRPYLHPHHCAVPGYRRDLQSAVERIDALEDWIMARAWRHHDWGGWPEDGLTFRVCSSCHGVDAVDYDRMVALGRMGAQPNNHLRGHRPGCLIESIATSRAARGVAE